MATKTKFIIYNSKNSDYYLTLLLRVVSSFFGVFFVYLFIKVLGEKTYANFAGITALLGYVGLINAGAVSAHKSLLLLDDEFKILELNKDLYSTLIRRYFFMMIPVLIFINFGFIEESLVILIGIVQLLGTAFTGFSSRLGKTYYQFIPYIFQWFLLSLGVLIFDEFIHFLFYYLFISFLSFSIVNYVFWRKKIHLIKLTFKDIFHRNNKILNKVGYLALCLQLFIAFLFNFDLQLFYYEIFISEDFPLFTVYLKLWTTLYGVFSSIIAVMWGKKLNEKLNLNFPSSKIMILFWLGILLFSVLFYFATINFFKEFKHNGILFFLIGVKTFLLIYLSLLFMYVIYLKNYRVLLMLLLLIVIKYLALFFISLYIDILLPAVTADIGLLLILNLFLSVLIKRDLINTT